MYLRLSRQKRADGSTLAHLQIAENVWDPEKKRSQARIVHNCGRADDAAVTERLKRLAHSILRRCSPEDIVASQPNWRLLDAWPYGDVHVLEKIWRRLGIDEAIAEVLGGRKFDFPVERALFAMVANRACAPASKLHCCEQRLCEDVKIAGADELELHHLHRAMDFLAANQRAIEEAVHCRMADLLNADVELIFHDTTSLHFEIDDEDEPRDRPAADGRDDRVLRRRGKSKNGRSDAPQLVVGLAVTRDGLPVCHWIFPGNTVDVTTVERVKRDLKGWRPGRCVFVGDAGMVSKDNLRKLALGGGRHIVCMPVHAGGEVDREVVSRPGRHRPVAGNLKVKEVVVGDGERRRRYVVCHNPSEAERKRRHREAVLDELAAELESLREDNEPGHGKRACALRASARYGRYVRLTRTGQPKIDRARIKAAERLDGKFVAHGNDDTLSAEDLALGCKQLQRVGEAWRRLKSGLKLRPVRHFAPQRIRAHVALSVLALLLERVAERACGDTWRNIRDDVKRIKLAQLSGPDGEVWQVTEPSPDAAKRLKSLQMPHPPPILKLA